MKRFLIIFVMIMLAMAGMAQRAGRIRGRPLPGAIWTLGLVSLFMDTSSELIHSLLPVFMVSVLGASLVTVGIGEGGAEATAAVLKVVSGAISDWLGKRKVQMVLGYALALILAVVIARTYFVVDHGIDNLGLYRRDFIYPGYPSDTFRGRTFWRHRQDLGGTTDRFFGGWQARGTAGWISDMNFLEE